MSKEIALDTGDQLPVYMQGTGRGSEGVSNEDLVIPRLNIIQALSPQRKKKDAQYIDGAEEGIIWNTVTRELLGTEVNIIPVYFAKEWIIWKDHTFGGGFYGSFATKAEGEAVLNQMEAPDQYELLDHHTNFCLLVDPSSTAENLVSEEVVLSFSKTKMKPSRQLNSMCKMIGGDRFSRLYHLESVEETNKNGDSYYNYRVTQKGFIPETWFRAAEELYENVKEGEKKAGHAVGDDIKTEKTFDENF